MYRIRPRANKLPEELCSYLGKDARIREMKTFTAIFAGFIACAMIAACQSGTHATPSSSNGYSSEMPININEDNQRLSETIKGELAKGETGKQISAVAGNLPPYVFSDQLEKDASHPDEAKIITIGSVLLLPVYQLGMNSPADFNGEFGFSGILAKKDASADWRKFFEVPVRYRQFSTDDPKKLTPTHQNVVGVFVQDKKIFVDAADNNGAGSGEGTMTRFSTDDGFTWKFEGCYYFGGADLQKTDGQYFYLHYDPFAQRVEPAKECGF